MTRLKILASLVMDAFYQQYAKESDFFKIEDFEAFCAPFFYQVLQEDFEKTRRDMIAMRIIFGDEDISLSDAWYTVEEFPVDKDKNGNYSVTIPSMFTFSKDIKYTSVKNMYPVDGSDCCGQFAKISANQCNSLRFLPKSDKTIYFYPLGNKLRIERVRCGLKKVNVAYIPSLDSECSETEVVVPENYVAEIMTRTYNFMTNAKNGAVIDKTNNQNPNKIVQTEIDVKQ